MTTRRWLAAIALVSAAACDGTGVVRPGAPSLGFGGSGTSLAAVVVGAWQRIVTFLDDSGFVHASETHWQFAADGTAVRAVIARNITAGIYDVQLSTARWGVEGTALRIEFVTPSPGVVVFEARVRGDTLYLAGQPYVRGAS